MNAFEPLFLLLALAAVGALLTAATLAATDRTTRAKRILRRLAVGAVAYFGVLIGMTAVAPRKQYRVGDPQCFDDWCITVVAAGRRAGADRPYEVALELRNRARRTPMGERGTVVYLTDASGNRYDPLPDPTEVPFDRRLEPGESVVTTRHFRTPPDASGLGLVYTHEGGFPIAWFVIGAGGWFAKPPIVRLE